MRQLLCRSDVPILTLTGPPGIGKTRLALQVAGDLGNEFADGVVFVSLAALPDPSLVPLGIASALELPDGEDQVVANRLRSSLRQKELLLLLDNFEHLLSAAPLVAELTSSCPSLKVLATSRAPLHLSGEHTFPVPPLALPDAQHLPPHDLARFDAVALFLQRAAAVDPSFTLTAANARDVVEICDRLDGLPLAIELAAARIRLLTPATIRARLVNRLLLLSGGPRDQPPRLQSMRDAIAWSYDLLAADEQTHLRRLAVFVDGFCPDGVARMTSWLDRGSVPGAAVSFPTGPPEAPSASLFRLGSSLVEKNLVQPAGDVEDQPRFRLLETVREFGLERLAAAGEEEAARDAHAETFLALAELAGPELRGPVQHYWFRRLEAAHANLRAALNWLQERGEIEAALRLAGALGRFWEARGHLSEGRASLRALLRALDQTAGLSIPPPIRARAEFWAGTLAHWQADYGEAESLLEAALRRFEESSDQRGAALALLQLGQTATCLGELDRGRQLITASLERFQEIGDVWGIAAAQTGLVNPLLEAGDLAAVDELLRASLPLARKVDDPDLLAMTLINVGWLASWQGEDARAKTALEESLSIFQELGERRTMPYTLNLLGLLAWRRGDRAGAATLFTDALTLGRDLGSQLVVVNSLMALFTVAVAEKRFEQAATLLGAAHAVRATIGAPVQPIERPTTEANSARLRNALGNAAYESAFAAGTTFSCEAAIDYASSFLAEIARSAVSHQPARADARSGLSPRELDVLRLVIEGRSNADIAASLHISPRTVRNHLTSIFGKLGVQSRTAAAMLALRKGLIATPPDSLQ